MARVELDAVTKVFPGGAVAVDGVSLSVSDGEFLVLVGPSGCGKSTILRIIAGLEEPSSGHVSIDGQVVDDLPPKDRDIAMVFQNYALYPHMTVRENLSFALRMRKVPRPRIRELVDVTARVLELTDLLDRRPKELSGGQRQRVAMGRAMVRGPRVFLLDEPLSNLDAKLRVSMRAELIRLHRQHHVTTVYVTHDQIEAMTLGDRIAVVDRGRLQQVGPPHELYHHPANVFVAGFLGSPGMNLVRGELVSGVEPTLRVGSVRWVLPARLLTRRPALRDWPDQPVIVGLRPDALTWPAPAGTPVLRATAVAVESLGPANLLLFRPPEAVDGAGPPARSEPAGDDGPAHRWTARVDRHCQVAVGDSVTFGVDLEAAHFFDPQTGLAIADRADRSDGSDRSDRSVQRLAVAA